MGRGRATNLEDLGCVAGVDVVTGRGTGVACHDSKICTGDRKRRTAIVRISAEKVSEISRYLLVGILRVEAVLFVASGG